MLATQICDGHAILCLLQDRPSRQILLAKSPAGQCMICASLYFDFVIRISSFIFEKILLPHTTKFRGDYRISPSSVADHQPDAHTAVLLRDWYVRASDPLLANSIDPRNGPIPQISQFLFWARLPADRDR